MRVGEIVALEWTDVDVERRQISIRHSDWRGQLTSPKNGRGRVVAITERVATAVRKHRHLRSSRVLCQDDDKTLAGCNWLIFRNLWLGGRDSNPDNVVQRIVDGVSSTRVRGFSRRLTRHHLRRLFSVPFVLVQRVSLCLTPWRPPTTRLR
jgi:integrase